MALFKSKVHNDQIDPTFNYVDFSEMRRCQLCRKRQRSVALSFQVKFRQVTPQQQPASGEAVLGVYPWRQSEKQARIKCSGSQGVKVCRGWQQRQLAFLHLDRFFWMGFWLDVYNKICGNTRWRRFHAAGWNTPVNTTDFRLVFERLNTGGW